jgi:hypothetical protein
MAGVEFQRLAQALNVDGALVAQAGLIVLRP